MALTPRRGRIGPQFIRADKMATKLTLAAIAGSVVFALFKGSFGLYLPLAPVGVLHGFLWQPFTYAFVGSNPMEVMFGALAIWSIGGSLEETWGAKRLLAFALSTTVLAGVLTVLLSVLLPRLQNFPYFGIWVMGTSLWVAYGLAHGRGQTNFWGIPLSGNTFALIGAGFIFLDGAYASPQWLGVVPHVFGLALTLVYIKLGSPRFFWLRFTSWRLQRRMRRRSKYLTLVSKERNIGGDSDRFLH